MGVYYEQELTLYELGDVYVSQRGRLLLPTLYNMTRLAPDAGVMFTGPLGIGITPRLIIPPTHISGLEVYGHLGRWDDQTDPVLGPFGSEARKAQELAADRVFVNKGDIITLRVDAPTEEKAYSLYAHLSYYVERQRIRTQAHRLLVAGEPEYFAPGT